MKIEDKVSAVGKLPQNGLSINSILIAVYALAALTAVGFVIYGGYNFIRSEGDVGKVQLAKQTVFWAIFGLVIVIFAAVITNFVIGGVEGAKS